LKIKGDLLVLCEIPELRRIGSMPAPTASTSSVDEEIAPKRLALDPAVLTCLKSVAGSGR
jgi:hypothetical protein